MYYYCMIVCVLLSVSRLCVVMFGVIFSGGRCMVWCGRLVIMVMVCVSGVLVIVISCCMFFSRLICVLVSVFCGLISVLF